MADDDTLPGIAARDAPGWYGKLSTLGDFAQRRLPPEFVQLADAWLSRSIQASREQLGADWLEVYLTAPVRRFAWAPGVVDAAWWFGVMMPSCDKVGRYFPLLIASRRDRPPQDRDGLDHLADWFDHLARAATTTLADGASVDAFEQALAAAPPWPPACAPALSAPTTAGHAERPPPEPQAGLLPWLQGVAAEALQVRFAGCSIWWQAGHLGQAATGEVVRGLPEPSAFAAMLSLG